MTKRGYCAYENIKKERERANDEKRNYKLHLYNDYHYDYYYYYYCDLRLSITRHYRERNIRKTKKEKEIVNRFHGNGVIHPPLNNVRFLSLIYP